LPQEGVADEAVMDDPLEHDVRIVLGEVRRSRRVNATCQAGEPTGIRATRLVPAGYRH
jgi:hypothetical protein